MFVPIFSLLPIQNSRFELDSLLAFYDSPIVFYLIAVKFLWLEYAFWIFLLLHDFSGHSSVRPPRLEYVFCDVMTEIDGWYPIDPAFPLLVAVVVEGDVAVRVHRELDVGLSDGVWACHEDYLGMLDLLEFQKIPNYFFHRQVHQRMVRLEGHEPLARSVPIIAVKKARHISGYGAFIEAIFGPIVYIGIDAPVFVL